MLRKRQRQIRPTGEDRTVSIGAGSSGARTGAAYASADVRGKRATALPSHAAGGAAGGDGRNRGGAYPGRWKRGAAYENGVAVAAVASSVGNGFVPIA